MDRKRIAIPSFGVATVALLATSAYVIHNHLAGAATTLYATYLSYNPSTGQMDLSSQIAYQLPDPAMFGPGPYPVAIHIPGTYEGYNSPLALLFVSQMAARGFLSASPAYANTEKQQSCQQYEPRAQGIFDSTRDTSATNTLCAFSQAACGGETQGGIVVDGISQGAELAALAANYDNRVSAVYAISGGDMFVNVKDFPLQCVDKANTLIPQNRITVINGSQDPFFDATNQALSGLACAPDATACWSGDNSGAGWYIVTPNQTFSGMAGHCYFFDGRNTSPYTCAGRYDPNWYPPAAMDWSLAPNLDWLATFGTHRNFAPQ
jgi:dienelactone hydrolase